MLQSPHRWWLGLSDYFSSQNVRKLPKLLFNLPRQPGSCSHNDKPVIINIRIRIRTDVDKNTVIDVRVSFEVVRVSFEIVRVSFEVVLLRH